MIKSDSFFSKTVKVGKRFIGEGQPAYIIADIGANFDGDLNKAKRLALAVKESGGDVVKIQSFKAKKIGIAASSSPYDFEAVDLMDELGVEFYKIGSGDITWHEMIEYISNKKKPVILATGASHTPGDVVVLGAIALGAKVIEKHFTLSKKDIGPDHPHSMEPEEFGLMVKRIRDMEAALGSTRKFVVPEESETVIVQRRGLCASKKLVSGAVLKMNDITELRPALGIVPKMKSNIIGKKIKKNLEVGEPIKWEDIM
ncbi:MAG: N-acetylneuraminate synthase family protein [Candidatus Vogelbacteria bacterium]|nr:N-acetylneuraminate synthase family protein [Candidatus Vogelbacteria bacterium]